MSTRAHDQGLGGNSNGVKKGNHQAISFFVYLFVMLAGFGGRRHGSKVNRVYECGKPACEPSFGPK
jgi:hypothetical protein